MNNQLKKLQEVIPPRAFVIPDYQRGYAWKEEHRKDLLDDLRDLAALRDPSKMHYTGTLVLHRGRHAPRSVPGKTFEVLDVIDGQQRLTTLVILLSVLARRLEAIGTDDAIEGARLVRADYIAYRNVQKVTPNGDAATFFRDHVLGAATLSTGSTLPERALLAARTEFEAYVGKHIDPLADDNKRVEWLDQWITLITTRLGFIVFEVADEADVGVMFEAMNARGKELTQSELVKNYLLFAAAKVVSGEDLRALTDDVNHTWRKLVAALDAAKLSDADDTFLRYHWWIWQHAKGPEGKSVWDTSNVHRALKSVIRVVDGADEVTDLIRDYLRDLRDGVKAFVDLSSPWMAHAFDFAPDARETLAERARGIRRIGRSAVVLPMLMASVMRFASDPAGLSEVLRLAETFVFRLTLMGIRANAGEPAMMSLARAARLPNTPIAAVQQRLRDLIQYYAPDNEVESALLADDGSTRDGNFAEWSHLPHLLFEYERSLVEKTSTKFVYDWTKFYKKWRESIEHILPQGDGTLSVPYWKKHFTPAQFKRSRHRLGNLTLTEWNSSYGNRGFDQKQGAVGAPQDAKVYRNSKFLCERELVDETQWDEAAIDKRQKRIADFAMARWKA